MVKTRSRSKTPKRKTTKTSNTGKRKRSTTTVTRKKRKTTSPKKLTTKSPAIRKHLQGFLDPFTVTGGAKIPDGAVMQSLPLTHRLTNEITSDNPPTAPIDILIYPGLQTGMFVSRPGLSEIEKEFRFTNDTYLDISGNVDGINWFDEDIEVITRGGVARWRLVSQALKLTLLNTDHENDGWFESARIKYKPDVSHWRLSSPIGNHQLVSGITWSTVNESAVFSADENLQNYINTKNLSEENSYVAGSLKDIHKHQFNLMAYDNMNEFRELYQKYLITADERGDALAQAAANYQEVPFKAGGTSGQKLYESMIDTNHDILLIRIHPGTAQTKLLSELAANHEVVYDVDSNLAKHMTPCDVDENAFKMAQQVKRATNSKSTMIVDA